MSVNDWPKTSPAQLGVAKGLALYGTHDKTDVGRPACLAALIKKADRALSQLLQ